MEIIKLRTRQIYSISQGLVYLEPTVEFKALQIRKVIEQILLASLVANTDMYKEYYNRLGTEWNARIIAGDLERINSDFFPKPAIDDYENHIISDDANGMSCNDLIEIYQNLGKYLHAKNPFGNPMNYPEIDKYLNECSNRIIKLLNMHTVKLVGGEAFLFVIMNSAKNGRVTINWFERVDEDTDNCLADKQESR